MRWIRYVAPVVVGAVAAQAQLEELVSQYVQVMRPRGQFVQRLIRLKPPSGDTWRRVEVAKQGFSIAAPASAQVETEPAESRVLHVTLASEALGVRPVLRVDAFTPGEGEPTEIDANYVADLAEEYPDRAFNGKFVVSDSGLVVVRKKTNLAMVGGSFKRGALPMYRLQWTYLSKDRQLFITFDCPEDDLPRHLDTAAQMILGLEVARAKGR